MKNTGKLDGEEVVQVYIRDKVASRVRPVKELKAFEKVLIKSGKAFTLEFTLTDKELGFFTADGDFVFEPGEFEFMVGGSSDNVLTKNITL